MNYPTTNGLVVALHRLPIRFRDVHYAYERPGPSPVHGPPSRPALSGFSLAIEPGERVALVGPTGAGKSTVASLLLRFIEPQGGEITVGDIPLRDVPAEEWRRGIAWVPQNPYLFHDTVAANILRARPEASHDEVAQAARLAHADPFIRALPQGYDTPIGERGTRLSAGQAQRIALARAILKDAPILILDEATSNLDPEHEALIQDALDRLLVGRTALIIAHRLATAARADRVVVLHEGRVVEDGSHPALLARAGHYRRLVEAGAVLPAFEDVAMAAS